MKCHFCHIAVEPRFGIVDIGGLKVCAECYDTRSTRDWLPCKICGKRVGITPNVLTTGIDCGECRKKADLPGAWARARALMPCDRCKEVNEPHHATCYGQNICHACYTKNSECTQLYPGDKGYPPFFPGVEYKPSLPAALLPAGEGFGCVVCGTPLGDPAGIALRFNLPTICVVCDGPKWWKEMNFYRTKTTEVEAADTPIIR